MCALRSLEIISIKDTIRTRHLNTKQGAFISMCIIKKQFYILSDGRVWYEGKSYDPQDCEFLEGSHLVLNTIDEKIEKPPKKQAKILHDSPPKEEDMNIPFILPDASFNLPLMQVQTPTNSTIEVDGLPPEVNQLQELIKLTGNNLPLAIALLVALVFYKDKKKKEQQDQDHAIACDLNRKDLSKKLEDLETQVKQIEKDQIKFAVGDDDLKDRIEKMEKKVKDLN